MDSHALSFPHLQLEEDCGNYLLVGSSCGPCFFSQESPTNHPHFHRIYELCLVFHGSGHFTHHRIRYPVSQGTVFIADPHVLHEIDVFDTGYLALVFFQFQILPKNGPSTSLGIRLAHFLHHHNWVQHDGSYLLPLLHLIHQTEPIRLTFLRSLILSLLLQCLESLTISRSPDPNMLSSLTPSYPPVLEKALQIVHQRIPRPISVSEVAKQSGTSLRNLEIYFRRYMNTTISRYIQTQRMRIAANYLLMGYRIQEVATLLEFLDTSVFSRSFRQVYGISPKRYQLQHALPLHHWATFQPQA